MESHAGCGAGERDPPSVSERCSVDRGARVSAPARLGDLSRAAVSRNFTHSGA